MRALRNLSATDRVAIATGVIALAFPPPVVGVVPGEWGTGLDAYFQRGGVVPEFDLEIWANASTNLTAAELLAGVLHPFVQADIEIDSVDHTADELTEAGHPLLTGDGPFTIASTVALPAGLEAGVSYWVIKTGANTFKLASSLANALNGTAVALTSNGSGTITLSDVAGDSPTQRVHWQSRGLLGLAGDGAITLTNQRAYSERRSHSALVVAYAVVATLSASDPETVSVAMVPVVDA